MTAQVDALDRAILGCLLRNARSTYAVIGQEVGLTAPAVKRRVDRLIDEGAIRGFTAFVDPAVLGWTTEAYVQLFWKGTVSPLELRRSLEKVPEVVSACNVSGAADALVQVVAVDIPHLESVIERLREEPKVDRTESVIVLSRLIDRVRT
ncbi:DNA-binding transcriptional regulator, Lrp family [Modestobacter sp. DSM 44400]|uniref:Lrp/AsnC family transcriptional regulator n=1 Tax=Modestobacter sp. DSM 44400 TaxID=1550230 RepID=UPI00089A3637|nr:Lrp/AsnC family transcriptional regulator [Modestobacter sp. DSM 44400]SDY74932.1 DNA-binding transcriptional regulator, Lrp family [Modestobacter sp. DSM 44400]